MGQSSDRDEPVTGRLKRIFDQLTGRKGGMKVSTVASEQLEDVMEPMPNLSEAGSQRARARFVDRGMVAKGGMAEIHRMFDKQIQRDVAMKVISEATPREVSRFVEEAQITGQLEHPNIVPVHEICADDSGTPGAFAMKLVEGKTLQDLVMACSTEHGPTERELESLLQIFLKVCDAVAFAHSKGVIHRDIKPENVMVGSFGQAYMMDWGLAKLMSGERGSESELPADGSDDSDDSDAGDAGDDSGGGRSGDRISLGTSRREARGEMYGTPAYMAMEQAFGDVESIDERTDVFGLGGVLYTILTQKPPHQSIKSVTTGKIPHPQDVVGERPLPGKLCEIAMKALEADQDDRYQDVSELRAAVEGFVRSGGWFVTRTFQAGDDIIREGDTDKSAYIIDSGKCEVWHNIDGVKHSINVLGPGEPFGETALFSDMPRTAYVTAVTEVKVAVITRENLDRELANHTWLRSLIKAVATRFVAVDRELRAGRVSEQPSDEK